MRRSPRASSTRRARGRRRELRAALATALGEADAVGHRVVHGGERFRDAGADRRRASRRPARARPTSRRCTSRSRSPRSTPSARALPELPAVACFDTAFHATLPAAAATYALPAAVARALAAAPLRLSRALARLGRAARAGAAGARPAGLRIVSCHLGAGRVAVRDRRRALARHHDGLHAARGAGDGDPLGQRRPRACCCGCSSTSELSRRELAERARARLGLLGLAGTADMREVLSARRGGDARGARWRSRYTCTGCAPRSRRWPPRSAGWTRSCSPAASASGRRRSVSWRPKGSRFWEWSSTPANASMGAAADTEISAAGASAATLVITAREDLEIARQVRTLLSR